MTLFHSAELRGKNPAEVVLCMGKRAIGAKKPPLMGMVIFQTAKHLIFNVDLEFCQLLFGERDAGGN